MKGFISIPQNQTQKGTTYQTLIDNLKAGDSLDGIRILSISLSYDGKNYNSDKINDENGVAAWVIAVSVVGAVIGTIAIVVAICCIHKKCKKNKEDNEDDDNEEASGKQSDSQFKKVNPEI